MQEPPTAMPITTDIQRSNLGTGELHSERLENFASYYDERNANAPPDLDLNFLVNDVPNWSEFLQMLDLPGDLVID